MQKIFETLYARDNKGKILQWVISVIPLGNNIDIRKSYGEYGGAQAIRWQRNIKGVNIGKSNATTPYQQAINEAESAIKRKKRSGYMTLEEAKAKYIPEKATTSYGLSFVNLTDDITIEVDKLYADLNLYLPKFRTDLKGNVKPMKAAQYYRSKKDWTDPEGNLWSDRKYYYLQNPFKTKEKGAIITKFPCIGQPKINGVRSLIQLNNNSVIITSKDGLTYNIPQISDFLNINSDIFFYKGENIVLDGELYIHGELLQDIASAVKKVSLNTARVVFVLFDIAVEGFNNKDRWDIIKSHIKPKLDIHLSCPIELIQSVKILNDVHAQNYTDFCIQKGFEGAMFRQQDAEYGFGKRITGITKLKRVIDTEFTITDIVPQDKDITKGNYQCITDKGLYFEVTPKGTDEFKRELLINKVRYIGKKLTCVFYEWTKEGKPFHIMNNIIRDYE